MSEEKKLQIDEGWKSQVDREKASLRSQVEAGTNQVAANDEPPADSEEVNRDLPPASLILLISSLASQAMAAMGAIPGDDGKPFPVNLKFARHFIDLIAVIEDKTRNNLTSDEASFLNGTLHHLRLQFVECSRR
jgi:Domain of unknown function (DUF1844)